MASANYNTNNVTVLLNDGAWIAADAPSITIGDKTATEGNTGTTTITFTVSLSAAASQAVTVQYATADGTAASSGDYQEKSGTLTIAPGQTSATVTVLLNGDRLLEDTEFFFVHLTNATNAFIIDATGTGAITDDEPRISINNVTKYEGNGKKTTLFVFTVTLSVAYDEAVTMSYRTVNGTATTADGDYIGKTGTLTFNPGETAKTITIEVKSDGKKEANETFYVDLFDCSSNSQFARNRGLGTIYNEDK